MNKDINLNLYKVFYYVAIYSSFKKASEELCVSQPAISKQIKNLEEYLNVKLFFRYNKSIELTEEGKILFEQLEKVDYYLRISEKAITSYKNLDYGELVIGCQSHIASFYLLDYIEKFRKDHPNIIVRIVSDSTSGLFKELRNHRVDFIIDNSPINQSTKDMIVEDLEIYDTILICNNNYKYKIKDKNDLNNKDFILPLNRSSMRKIIDNVFENNSIHANVILSVDTTDLIISSVEKNMGIGYVVRKAVENDLENQKIKELETDLELPKFELKLVYNQEYLSYLAQEFIKKYIKK